ncbi:glucosamine-6-phosphate deaminase [Spiroplasma turonicum]|uniref:Glucosamine-6-phosphate deaminase n=1 Tax=Spiroplasma turonicum TaxID=216946 RepID=A0A0K1P7D8_9MOLU|nr:glucosamine-6-phosphate deaminase [Spiroplasma turonicum]AKU80215.1 glucosamine-6-phosphate deaminase [Spiroplasma turonicum]ALX71215.1 glucosamine-6-phosphate deaminase [Spiroplasma turonicum]
MKKIIVKNQEEGGKIAGDLLLSFIQENSSPILGLATGSTPISTYKYLINKTKEESVDWSNVMTFNLDEYIGLAPEHEQSYRYFMNEELFDHINIDKDKTFVPDGLVKSQDEASKYDDLISSKGGIGLQLLGIGINGHIGFNEPGTSFDSITSIVDLTKETIEANSRFFDNISDVPKKAISMGLKSIMNAKKIVLLAFGSQKAEAIKHLINGEVSPEWPCTILQKHDDVTIIIDEEAASKL